MVGAVEGGKSFEVRGCPGVFALEELVNFALGGGAAVYGSRISFFGLADERAGFTDTVLCLGEWLASNHKNEQKGVVLAALRKEMSSHMP